MARIPNEGVGRQIRVEVRAALREDLLAEDFALPHPLQIDLAEGDAVAFVDHGLDRAIRWNDATAPLNCTVRSRPQWLLSIT